MHETRSAPFLVTAAGPPDLSFVTRAARVVELRARLCRTVDAACTQLGVALVALAPSLALAKLGRAPAWLVRDVAVAGALSVALAVALAAARRLPPLAGTRRLDRHHGLAGRLSSALAFAALPPSSRTPMMALALEDAAAHAARLSPRAAYPLRAPRDLAATLLLACGVAALGSLELRVHRPPPPLVTIDAPDLAAEDVELFRDVARDLAKDARTPEIAAAVAQMNQLVEDLASKRLDRAEAFRRLEALEADVKRAQAADAKAVAEALAQRARALRPSAAAKPLAGALDEADLAKAEREMRELAKRLRSGKGAPTRAELEKLRDAMKKASAGQKERLAALDRQREELREQLLQRRDRGDGGPADEEEERLLRRRERELERLDRDAEQAGAAERRLDRLDRALAQAAEDLMRELGDAAKDLEQGAEDIHRMAEEQMSDEQREELVRRLEELRDQLRQGGAEAKERLVRMRRFGQSARGQGGKKAGQPRACPPDDPSCKPEDQEGAGDGQDGEGKDGEGQLTEGEGDEQVLVLRKSSRRGGGTGAPSGASTGQGQAGQGSHGPAGGPNGGKDWGEGHDPNVAGAESKASAMGTQDVQAAAVDTGQGQSRSQTIYGAAERGFRGGAYQRVWTEYRTSVEKALERDQVPPGATGHVRRYFDLIRPRD